MAHASMLAIPFVVVFAASAFAQNIQVSPSALSATVVEGQSTTLTLHLQKTGTSQHVWEPVTSVEWITLSPAYGSSNTITTEVEHVRATIDSSSMALGTNSGLVYIWESGPDVSRLITVPVTVTVSQTGATSPPSPPPPPPVGDVTHPPPPPSPSSLNSNITAFPAALSAHVVNGQSTTLTLNLQKTGTTQHVWEPTTSVGWITLSPAYGSANTITTEPDQIRVTINSSGMALGTNSGLVYVWDSGPDGSRLITVPVTVTVSQTGTTTPPSPLPPPPASPLPASLPPVGGVTPPPPSPANGVATVTWAANGETDLAGYKLYVGTSSGVYSNTVDVANVTSYSISLPKGVTYFFVLTAYDASGNESAHSSEISRSLY